MARLPLLDGGLAATIAKAASRYFLDATFEPSISEDVTQTDAAPEPWNPVLYAGVPPVPTRTKYACKAIQEEYGVGYLREGLVEAGECRVLILANTMRVWPDGEFVFPETHPGPGDVITIRLQRFVIVAPGGGVPAVRTDPAGAMWDCRCAR